MNAVGVLALLAMMSSPEGVSFEPRDRLGVVIITGEGPRAPETAPLEIIEQLDRVLKEHSSLSATPFDASHPFVRAFATNASMLRWFEALSPAEREGIPFILVLSVYRTNTGLDHFAPIWLDVRAGVTIVAQEGAKSGSDVDLVLARRASLSARTFEVGGANTLGDGLNQLITSDLRDALSLYFDQGFGTLELEMPRAGMKLRIDDRALEPLVAGRATLFDVRQGRRTISLEGDMPASATVLIRRNQTTSFNVGALEPQQQVDQDLRARVAWSGVAMGVLGVAATTMSVIAQPPINDGGGCVGDGCRRGNYFATWCDISSGANCHGRGLTLAPVGLAIATAGASWWLGSEYLTRDSPWLSVIGGLAVGTLTFVAAHALGDVAVR